MTNTSDCYTHSINPIRNLTGDSSTFCTSSSAPYMKLCIPSTTSIHDTISRPPIILYLSILVNLMNHSSFQYWFKEDIRHCFLTILRVSWFQMVIFKFFILFLYHWKRFLFQLYKRNKSNNNNEFERKSVGELY